jgi:actin-related protein
MKGFKERLEEEVQRKLMPDETIKVVGRPEAKYSAWIGGSCLASLTSFKDKNFISK